MGTTSTYVYRHCSDHRNPMTSSRQGAGLDLGSRRNNRWDMWGKGAFLRGADTGIGEHQQCDTESVMWRASKDGNESSAREVEGRQSELRSAEIYP
jgi:hypothetical protein